MAWHTPILHPVSARAWRRSALTFILFLAIACPLASLWGLVRWEPVPWSRVLPMAVAAFFLPALAEEALFRAALVPHPGREVSRLRFRVQAGAALVLFVLWHPLNACLFLEAARPLFLDPRFLLLAALLGIGATYCYLESGSIWPPVLFHWLIVMLWKACGGGPWWTS